MSSFGDDLELLSETSKAAIENAARRQRSRVRVLGQSQGYDPETGLADVRLDGDSSTIYGVPNLSGSWPYLGERVVCEFVPPQGIYVESIVRPVGPPAVIVSGPATPVLAATSTPLTMTTFLSGRLEYFEIILDGGENALQCHIEGWFDMTMLVSFPSGAAGRRFFGAGVNNVTGTPGGLFDLLTGGTGLVTATGTVPIQLHPGDFVKPRALSSVAQSVTLEHLSLRWRDRPSIWFGG